MPRRKKATPGQEPEAVAAEVEEAPEETPALPAEEPADDEVVVEVEIVVEEAAVVAEPEPVDEPAEKPVRVGGYVATPHGWRPVH